MSDTDYKVGYGKPPRHTRFKKGAPSANRRGRPRKDLAALLVEGLNKTVVVTENGRRRKITVREAVVTQLINKSATADLRATKMLLDLIKDAEKETGAAAAPEPSPPFTKADEEVVATLIERLRHQILTEMAATATSPEQTFSRAGSARLGITTVSRRRHGKHGDEARITKHLLIAFQNAIGRPDY